MPQRDETATVIFGLSEENVAELQVFLDAEADDFMELIGLSGLDPTTDFRDMDFSGCNLGEVDIEGWDLSGAYLDGTDLSQVKNINKAIFNTKTSFVDTKLPDGITLDELIY